MAFDRMGDYERLQVISWKNVHFIPSLSVLRSVGRLAGHCAPLRSAVGNLADQHDPAHHGTPVLEA